MKHKKLVAGLASLGVLGLAGAGLMAANAATSTTSDSSTNRRFELKGNFNQLTDEQKAELETQRSERQAEMESRRAAVEAALQSNDYQAWLAAVGSDSPMAEKITADNFSQLIKAHSLQKEAREIMSSLGLETGPFGPGAGHGNGPRGMGRGMMSVD